MVPITGFFGPFTLSIPEDFRGMDYMSDAAIREKFQCWAISGRERTGGSKAFLPTPTPRSEITQSTCPNDRLGTGANAKLNVYFAGMGLYGVQGYMQAVANFLV